MDTYQQAEYMLKKVDERHERTERIENWVNAFNSDNFRQQMTNSKYLRPNEEESMRGISGITNLIGLIDERNDYSLGFMNTSPSSRSKIVSLRVGMQRKERGISRLPQIARNLRRNDYQIIRVTNLDAFANLIQVEESTLDTLNEAARLYNERYGFR